MAKVDFSDTQSGVYDPIPAGTYLATVFDAEERTSKEGNAYIAWEFAIQEGEHKGRHLWMNSSFSAKSLPYLKDLLKQLGMPEKKLSGSLEFDPADFAGTECRLVVKFIPKGYQGEPENRISRVCLLYTSPSPRDS